MASSKSTSALAGYSSCLKKTRKRTHETKTTRSVHFDGYPALSQSFADSTSSINNNHSKARLELLSASSVSNIAAKDRERNRIANALSSEYLVKPNYIEQHEPLSQTANSDFVEQMIRKYSGTNLSPHSKGAYDPKSYKSIVKKYSATNGEDIMTKYGAKFKNGEILRKYSVMDYDKTMRNYNPMECKEIMRKYSETRSDSKDDYSKRKIREQMIRKSSRSGLARYEDNSHMLKRNAIPMKVDNRLSKDKSSTTKFGGGSRNPMAVTKVHVPQHKPRKDAKTRPVVSMKYSGGNRIRMSKKPFIEKEKDKTGRTGPSSKRASAETTLARNQHHHQAADALPSRKSSGAKVRAKSSHGKIKVKSRSSRNDLQLPFLSKTFSPRVSNHKMGYVEGSRQRGTDSRSIGSPTTSVTPRDIYDDEDYFADSSNEGDVRLQHLLNRQAKARSYSPSTPVDRKELSKSSPRSIYERNETEHRREQRKASPLKKFKQPVSSPSDLYRFYNNPRRMWSKHATDKMRFNRLDNIMPSQGVYLESRMRMESGTPEPESEDGEWGQNGIFTQTSSDSVNDVQFQNMLLSESQQRAYDVYRETGQRATKHGDLMEIVKYYNNDLEEDNSKPSNYREWKERYKANYENNHAAARFSFYNSGANSAMMKDTADTAGDGGVDQPEDPPTSKTIQEDFVSDYRRLHREIASEKENVSPSVTSFRAPPAKAGPQHGSIKSLDDMRRHSVGTWLHRRSRCSRCV